MKKGQINTILLIIALILGGINLYRYYMRGRQAASIPKFEIFDVRTFSDLEPMTIVHYQMKNIGSETAYTVMTGVSPIDGNISLEESAFFENISVGGTVSVNRKILPGNYTQLKIGVYCFGFKETKYYTVEPDLNPEPPLSPDFIVYNLSLTSITEDNQTRAIFWIMNIGGEDAHNVNVSLASESSTVIPLLPQEDPRMITLVLESTSLGGVDVLDVDISCDEGVRQSYYLEEYQ